MPILIENGDAHRQEFEERAQLAFVVFELGDIGERENNAFYFLLVVQVRENALQQPDAVLRLGFVFDLLARFQHGLDTC
ncbi:hypothetical protein SE17_26040, partial [Kouleothrix aurantiaca]